MSPPLLLGADGGGTATRAVLATADGRIVGRGEARAGNPVATDPAEAAAALGAAVEGALRGHDPVRVAGGVFGLAGGSRLAEPAVAARYAAEWARLGLSCPMRSVGDAEVAFAAGTPESTGTVLIAGTGAVAAELRDGTVARVADGLGWLLGDEGSGFWIGLNAVRAVARALYAGTATGRLGAALCQLVATTDPDTFATRIYQLDRAELAALAPLVTGEARAGDPVARDIVAHAAERLAETLLSLHPAPGPVVLAGGVLAGVPEIRAAVRDRIAARLGRDAVLAGAGAAGAAWLAIDHLTRRADSASAADRADSAADLAGRAGKEVHARLLAAA
ncbi:BadF/BadG/BcrA/BcrD ATPase family protein [Micromonospora sp. NPDC049559]|uniref:N-acetylglucosamine kinase n=1 Tax=Micromonospora sp. NPDC049559 TaxID=3155923 RepID=UPI0034382BFF